MHKRLAFSSEEKKNEKDRMPPKIPNKKENGKLEKKETYKNAEETDLGEERNFFSHSKKSSRKAKSQQKGPLHIAQTLLYFFIPLVELTPSPLL